MKMKTSANLFRNNWDKQIFEEVYVQNEYGVEFFAEDDVVVDLGGQAGFFSVLAADRGSKRVYTYEANPTNFSHLQSVIVDYQSTIVAENCAVWRSDIPVESVRVHLGPDNPNTGMSNSLYDHGVTVPAKSLDSILSQFEKVKFLKIDVEGAEFPILLTAKELGRVETIVGEIHEISRLDGLTESARVPGYTSYTKNDLIQCLEGQGFEVTMTPLWWSNMHYMMRAVRR